MPEEEEEMTHPRSRALVPRRGDRTTRAAAACAWQPVGGLSQDRLAAPARATQPRVRAAIAQRHMSRCGHGGARRADPEQRADPSPDLCRACRRAATPITALDDDTELPF